MRFCNWANSPSNPKIKGRRVIKFLWWPTKIGDERRWLEYAMIEQEKVVQYKALPRDIGPSGNYRHWRNKKWLN